MIHVASEVSISLVVGLQSFFPTVLSARFGMQCNELPIETRDYLQKQAMISSIKALESIRFRDRSPFKDFHGGFMNFN